MIQPLDSVDSIASALSDAPLLVAASDLAGTLADARGAWPEILGWSCPEVVGKSFIDLCHPDDRAAALEAFGRVATGYVVPRAEFRMLHRRGSSRHIAWFGPGKVVDGRVVGIGIDVTSERVAREAEREARERLASVMETVPDYITCVDREGVVTFINRTYPGVATSQVVGTNLINWLAPADRDRFAASLARIVAGGAPEAMVAVGSGESGPTWYESRLGPLVEDGKIVGVIIVGRDISRERRAEEQERQRSRLELAGLMTAQVAHDINNLLSLVVLGVEGARAAVAEGDALQARSFLNEVLSAMDRSRSVTQELLRPNVSPHGPLDLVAAVRETRSIVSQALGPAITLALDLPDAPLMVELATADVPRILMNLATNSRRALPEGGRVVCRVRPGSPDDPILRNGRAPAAALVFEDNGHGMPWEVQSRAFEPFFTFGPHQGTGLGLASIYRIVQGVGGEASLRSAMGRGTTVTLHLPPPTSNALPAPARPPEPPTHAAGSETVLVADDEPAIRSFVSRYLSRLGYRVLEATGMEDAVRVAGAHPSNVDLLVTDVHMPDGSGFHLAELLSAKYRGLKRVFITGYLAPEDQRRSAGAPILEKPFAQTQLAKVVRALLDGRGAGG